ncbi:MAG: hypothetical protein PHV99_02485 [Candidatus Pacebacteria bacterium]|nr:hypothetical protein [Candidatus Paceibacterota bacterium]
MVEGNLKAALEAVTAKDAPWGACVRFLDSIASLEELEQLKSFGGGKCFIDLVGYYEENLRRWNNPQLPEDFEERYPLVAKRLDTSEKIRIFLRGAAFRAVDPMTMGDVFEDILRRHKNGENRIVYRRYLGDQWCDALRIVYHTQLQAWTLTELLLPEAKSMGISSNEGLFIDWRTKEERKAVGGRWPFSTST